MSLSFSLSLSLSLSSSYTWAEWYAVQGSVACEGWLGRAAAVSLAEHQNHTTLHQCMHQIHQNTNTPAALHQIHYRILIVLHHQIWLLALLGLLQQGFASKLAPDFTNTTRAIYFDASRSCPWNGAKLQKATQLKLAKPNFANIRDVRIQALNHKDTRCPKHATNHRSQLGNFIMDNPQGWISVKHWFLDWTQYFEMELCDSRLCGFFGIGSYSIQLPKSVNNLYPLEF